MANDLKIDLVQDSPDLCVWEHRAKSDYAVLCLSGVGTDPDATPGHEFAMSATGNGARNVMFVSDPNRTWLNEAGLVEDIVDRFEKFVDATGAKWTIGLGHSMGGFAALVLSGFTRIDRVLALAPQFSVDPQIVPEDDRWMEHREKLTEFRIRDAGEYMNETTDYVIVHGRHPRETPQRERFPVAANIRHFVLPGTHHNVPQKLKAAGLLSPFIKAVFDGRIKRTRMIMEDNFSAEMRGANQVEVAE